MSRAVLAVVKYRRLSPAVSAHVSASALARATFLVIEPSAAG
jgi:hypothetical protein